jgi:hypothetical protein
MRAVHECTESQERKATPINWTQEDDLALVAGALILNAGAWAELLKRYDAAVTKRIKFVIRRSRQLLGASDALDEIKAEFHRALFTNNMNRLRQYKPELGTLEAWLVLIAEGRAFKRLLREMNQPESIQLEDHEQEQNESRARGGDWIGGDTPFDGLWFDELRGEPTTYREKRRRRRVLLGKEPGRRGE